MAATIDDLDVVDLSDLDNGGEDNQQNGGEQTTPPDWTSEPDPDNGGEGSDDGDVITDVLKSMIPARLRSQMMMVRLRR